ncbi:MAG: hypothetical protein SFW36_09635 [Leptolyngbyaceae cyanobacterium bins.59]|nr:hypothetical protein [Leptolyngbyaceae cyanobacterium bins.59]
MSQPEILTLAKQGNPQAITIIMNRSPQFAGVIVKVVRQGNALHILLESVQPPDRETGVSRVARVLEKLELETAMTVRIYARQSGEKQAIWNQEIQLTPTTLVDSPQEILEPVTAPGTTSEAIEEGIVLEEPTEQLDEERTDLDVSMPLSDNPDESFPDSIEAETIPPDLSALGLPDTSSESSHSTPIVNSETGSMVEQPEEDALVANSEFPDVTPDEVRLEDELLSIEEEELEIELDDSLLTLESSLLDLDSSLSEEDNSLLSLEDSPSDLESSLLDLETSPSDLEDSPSDLETSPSNLESSPEELESSFPTLETASSSLESSPEDPNDFLLGGDNLDTDLDDLSSEPGGLSTNPENVSSDLDDLGVEPHNLSGESAPLASPPDASALEIEPALPSPELPMSDSEIIAIESAAIVPEDESTRHDPSEPGLLAIVESNPTAISVRETLKKPEAIAFLFLIAFITLWEAFILLLEETEPVDISLSGRGLARRLDVSASTISRRRDREDFTAWTQELDPQGTAWVMRADGRFIPAPASLPAAEMPQEDQ